MSERSETTNPAAEQERGETREQLFARYTSLINKFRDKNSEIKRLKAKEARIPVGVIDEAITFELRELGKERHEIHLQLIEVGESFGKDKDDVLVDIIRQERSLEEFGLPEFSILIEGDVIDTKDWHNQYIFNLDDNVERPGPNPLSEQARREAEREGGEDVVGKDKVMIVFCISPVDGWEGETEFPDDYTVRYARAKALAKEVGGEIFDGRDSAYHEAYADLLGVIVPKKDLEKIASQIRDNAGRFRLGDEFYSEDEKREIREFVRGGKYLPYNWLDNEEVSDE